MSHGSHIGAHVSFGIQTYGPEYDVQHLCRLFALSRTSNVAAEVVSIAYMNIYVFTCVNCEIVDAATKLAVT